jgi:hypothetical protein
MKKDSHRLLLFRVMFSLIGVAILLYCASQYFAVNGNLTITQNFNNDDDSIVSLFIPANQASDIMKNLRTGETTQTITEGPVYFTVKLPRAFDSVTAKIQYATDYHGPIRFGVIELLNPLATKEKTIDVPLLRDALTQFWQNTTDELTGNTVYSKDGLTLAEVQDRAKNGEPIATVGADLQVPYRDPNYTPNNSPHTIPNQLRGSHLFYTYIKDETLRLTLDVVDTNVSIGSDPISVVVRNEKNEVIETQKFSDDGNQTNDRMSSEPKRITVEKSGLPEGVYQIVVQTSGDVLLENLITQQQKFVVKDYLLFGNESESFTVQLGSRTLTAVTDNAAALGSVDVDGRSLLLHTINQAVVLKEVRTDETTVVPVRGNKADVSLSYSGYAAFEPTAYFDPDFAIQAVTADVQLSDVSAIVVRDFTPPVENYRGLEAAVDLPLAGVLGDRKKLQFVLEAPELLSEKESIIVDSITLEFHRASLWSRLSKRFSE